MQEWITQLGVIVVLLSNLVSQLPTANTSAAQTLEVQETVQAVIEAHPLDEWIEKLVQKESNGREDIVILDVNGKKSYSCLQFQEETFERYSKRYGIEGSIMSCDFQRRLAKLMIEENPRNARHWYHSVFKRGLGMPPTL